MGFLDGVGSFVGLAQEHFKISYFMAQLIPLAGFIMFGILSIPMGLLQDRVGKKFILLTGLVIAFLGVAISFFGLSLYLLFLATILLLGAGASLLQVAGNPIMRDVSAPNKYSRNLSIGQFVKAIGSVSAPLGAFVAAKWLGMDWQILFPLYSLTLLATIVLLGLTRIEEKKEADAQPATLVSCLALLGNPYILMTVLGIFLYVGLEVCISSGVPIYLSSKFDIELKTWGVLGNAFFFVWILTGRFLGSVVLNWVSAKKFLLASVLVALVGVLGLLLTNAPSLAVASIVLAGLGCANIFPLIFSITVDHMPERSNEISGLMVTAIVGGAFVPPLMGLLADITSVTIGFVVPLACVLYLLGVALACLKARPADAPA